MEIREPFELSILFLLLPLQELLFPDIQNPLEDVAGFVVILTLSEVNSYTLNDTSFLFFDA
jgi:hypothetical protein